TAGLVLAAGGGSRLGLGAKALLRSGGTTLVERAVGALRGCAPVLVVVGAQAEAVAARVPGARVVPNPEWASGLASSFRAGVAALPGDAERVVVVLVDQPDVGPEVVARLLREHRPGRIVAATYGGGEAVGGQAADDAATAPRARHPMVFDASLARRAAETA